MEESDAKRPVYMPSAPYDEKKLDIPRSLVIDLFLRRLYSEGTSNLTALKEALRLPLPIIEGVFHHFRKE